MRASVVVLLLLAGCVRPAPAPPPRVPVPVAVLPAANRTGAPLLVAGGSLLERWAAGTDRVTVEDVLTSEMRLQLERRGVATTAPEVVDAAVAGRVPAGPETALDVARAGKLGGSALWLQVRQWEPDGGTHPAFVIVGVDAVLLDVATGERVWTARRAPRPVATPGAITVGDAYATAARKIAEELLAGWSPPP